MTTRVTAGRTRHTATVRNFNSGLFFGRRHLAEGNRLSASGLINPNVPFVGLGEIPWACAQSLYAVVIAALPRLVHLNRWHRGKRRNAISTTCFGISWKISGTTCRLPPSCRERSMARNYGVPRHTNGNYRASLWPLLTLAFFMVGIIDVAVHLRHW